MGNRFSFLFDGVGDELAGEEVGEAVGATTRAGAGIVTVGAIGGGNGVEGGGNTAGDVGITT